MKHKHQLAYCTVCTKALPLKTGTVGLIQLYNKVHFILELSRVLNSPMTAYPTAGPKPLANKSRPADLPRSGGGIQSLISGTINGTIIVPHKPVEIKRIWVFLLQTVNVISLTTPGN